MSGKQDDVYNVFVVVVVTGHIDHSARVMRVITWNRSFRGISLADDGKDDFDKEENETHATVLDKLLAWEKKLYDEVKVKPYQSSSFNACAKKIHFLRNDSCSNV